MKKYVYRKKTGKVNFQINEIPWTPKQQQLIQLLQKRKTKCCFISGCAGTSKTLCSVYAGLQLLKSGHISDITYVRSPVESSSQKMGFLPGEMNDKFQVYTSPLIEKLEELIPSQEAINNLHTQKRVIGLPINYMRGLHMSGRLLILDESQNFTFEELLTATTRIGEASRIWILGDPVQSDLPQGRSGFVKFKNMVCDPKDPRCDEHGVYEFNFTIDDVLRSEFCKFILTKKEEMET